MAGSKVGLIVRRRHSDSEFTDQDTQFSIVVLLECLRSGGNRLERGGVKRTYGSLVIGSNYALRAKLLERR